MKHKVPNVNFRVRELGEWVTKTSDDYFKGKRVVVFGLPGAFTPTCSSKQLPGYETKYNEIKERNIDEVYCISVNDSFVMNAWAKHYNIQNVKVLPDGNSEFTSGMGMLVEKSNLGFGKRSWRYVAIISGGTTEKIFEEPGREDNCPGDPYGVTSPQNILSYLKGEDYKEK